MFEQYGWILVLISTSAGAVPNQVYSIPGFKSYKACMQAAAEIRQQTNVPVKFACVNNAGLSKPEQ